MAFALGGVLLAGEAAVHAEQYVSFFNGVPTIGPLFLVNAVACVTTVAGLLYARIRQLAAVAGIAISTVALASLVVSYGRGLFGWQESGFTTEMALAVIAEAGAVVVLASALALRAFRVR